MTYLYLIQRGYGSIKIGVSDDPESRLAQLQTGAEKRLRLIAKFPMPTREEAFALEKEMHQKLSPFRMKGEWFHRRILREMRGTKSKRLFGGTNKNPLVKTSDGWTSVQ